jgi:hypothetical protein
VALIELCLHLSHSGIEPGAVGRRVGLVHQRRALPEAFYIGNRYDLVLLSGL